MPELGKMGGEDGEDLGLEQGEIQSTNEYFARLKGGEGNRRLSCRDGQGLWSHL